ncbi:dethiobiotin synthase [Desulfosalsimonas propionicica]|uniref:ATP-dependent dethiobiotin synthetase BioD n=1 Tax=Desulfosalsimonas propionicica TaxID=332175 RepID=A0A7W0C707_9BACT|nr:dethiobiotin synthase [Desulfosalsimonas propionicica]MBA2880350.1 dethiobiotin synthase [Desulfosalsimonas propionicica]
MTLRLPERFFIAGTDTGIGKTMTAAILMAGLKGTYWKPIQSGHAQGSDTGWIMTVTGLPKHHFHPETYRLSRPLSPHAAARADGLCIDLEAFALPECTGPLIVEGAGGIMVPLNEKAMITDLIKHLGLPVLLVAKSGLGTINHTLLSLEQLKRREIAVAGIVLNGEPNPENREAIADYGKVPLPAEIPPLGRVDAKMLAACFQQYFQ